MSERLEEIKETFGVHKIQTFADRKTIPFNIDEIDWLIEQVVFFKKKFKKMLFFSLQLLRVMVQ